MLGLCMLVLLMVLKEWVMNAERQYLNVELRLMIILVTKYSEDLSRNQVDTTDLLLLTIRQNQSLLHESE